MQLHFTEDSLWNRDEGEIQKDWVSLQSCLGCMVKIVTAFVAKRSYGVDERPVVLLKYLYFISPKWNRFPSSCYVFSPPVLVRTISVP